MSRSEEQGLAIVREQLVRGGQRPIARFLRETSRVPVGSALLLAVLGTLACFGCGSTSETAPVGKAGASNESGYAGMPSSGMSGSGGVIASSGAAPDDTGVMTAGGLGGEGGALEDESLLGKPCNAPGMLGCAGPHQKLTLVCSGAHTWNPNQTCPSGQFCDSSPGPDQGICKVPLPDCSARAPGDTFCADNDLMRCGPDALSSETVDVCPERCVDGKCLAFECPSNVYSCDAHCPAEQGAPGCYNVCAAGNSGAPPLLNLPTDETDRPYVIGLPPVPSADAECNCHFLRPSLAAVAFQLRNPPQGHSWRVHLAEPWKMRAEYMAVSESGACTDPKGLLWWTSQCEGLVARAEPPTNYQFTVWLGIEVPATEAARVSITLVPTPSDRNFVCDDAL